MDKNYLKFFCLCFKCLEFFYIKKNCPDNLNTNTTGKIHCSKSKTGILLENIALLEETSFII